MKEADSPQGKLLDFMGRPEAYDPPPATVERIDTHASIVFLAGPFAYKVKRAVKYPFLDFSTLDKRRDACCNELRVNARTAPQLYLEVVPVNIGKDGTFELNGKGKVVEWVLHMRRFGQDTLFDRMAGEGRLPLASMPALAVAIATFHDSADRLLNPDQSVVPLEGIVRDNEKAFASNPKVIPPEAALELIRLSRERLAALSPSRKARAPGGYVRHCHGDLHLRNIVEIDGAPMLFDAIEFDDSLATIDVLYDLAFLLMDLGKRGLTAHANAVLNAYLDHEGSTANLIGLAALPLFLAMRAAIRAKVGLLRAKTGAPEKAAETREEARSYFDLARSFLTPLPPRFIAIGGLSGSGKSAISRAIAPYIGAFPGAVHVRSDVERKRLFGVPQTQKLPERAYAPEVSDQVYAMCRKRALMALQAGQAVIVDAVHAKPAEREALAALAAKEGVAFTGLWLEAPPEVMRQRVASRTRDVSDATPPVVDTQLTYDIGKQDFEVIDATLPFEQVVASCLDKIGAAGKARP
jgi:aminoglycoside phosphotransferase family enzyme/predicted kinase